jgi:hypothetical protein
MLHVLSDDEVRTFVQEALMITGDASSVEDRIVKKWIDDRESHGMNERADGYDDGYSAGYGQGSDDVSTG